MQYISECFEEHHKRWSKIGQITGFPHSPRDTNPMGVEQPPHTAFPLPPRRYSVRLPEASLSTYSIASSIGARSFRQSRYRTSSGSINGSRNSDPFVLANQLALPSLKERETEYVQRMDKDSAFSSSSSSAQSSFASTVPQSSVGAHSSTGSHSSSGSHSSNSYQSTDELTKDQGVPESLDDCNDASDSLTKTGLGKMRGKDRRKKKSKTDSVVQARDSGSDDGSDSSTNSLPHASRGSVRSLNKASLSSDV